MKKIVRKVISYCDIPEELTEEGWLSEQCPDSYVEMTIATEDKDGLDEWILKNYSEIKEGETILIHIDY